MIANQATEAFDLKFRGFYTKENLNQAVTLAKQLNSRSKRLRTVMIVLLFIIGGVIFLGGILTDGQFHWIDIGRAVPAFLLGVFFHFEHDLSTRSMAYQLWRNEAVRREMKGKMTQDAITYYIGSKRVDYPWKEIAKIFLEQDFLVLVTNRGIMCTFPCNFFHKDSDWEDLRTFITTKQTQNPALENTQQ